MISAVLWFLTLLLLGWLAFPIAYRFLGRLPDKGFSLSIPLALLIWGFLYWILGSYGLLGNNLSGLLLALALLLALSYWAWQDGRGSEIYAWIKAHSHLILTQQVLFLLAFALMAYMRSLAPQATGTEKPMELAFLNSILQSPSMPPSDPWLSGFSISYYYFGYLMISMLAQLTQTLGAVAFNLGLAMVFALGAVASYGLAYNLLSLLRTKKSAANRYAALLAPLFVLILGNLEGLFEVMHSLHWFWSTGPDGIPISSFWAWLDLKDLVSPPLAEPSIIPSRYLWWWRASRVINDVNFLGIGQELIDEFPAFSFVLGDLHPHVLTIPFSFLTIGAGLNLFLGGGKERQRPGLFGLQIEWPEMAFLALLLGSLAFLNIWDFPIYLVLISGIYLIMRANEDGWSWDRLLDFFHAFFIFAIAGVLIYLPYYIGFSSQASGFLPNLLNPTRGIQLWIMFGTAFLPLFGFYIFHQRESGEGRALGRALLITSAFVLALLVFSLALAWLLAGPLGNTSMGQYILGLGAADLPSLLGESLSRRLSAAGGWITILLLLAFPLSGLLSTHKVPKKQASPQSALTFIYILGLFAALLITAPEFIFLRDQFSTRMNTVFKFYMQAWLVLGVVAAVVAVLWIEKTRGVRKVLALSVVTLTIAAASIYPLFAFPDRYRPSPDSQPSLDASSFLSASERAAAEWLRTATEGVLVEAVGGQYSEFARYATHSGQSGVLGWPGHESQWRGGSAEFGQRQGDIEALYSVSDWIYAQAIIDRYAIEYVVVGALERSSYNVNEAKFLTHLDIAYQNDAVTIYQIP